MTSTEIKRPRTISDLPWPIPVAVLGAIGLVAGIWWFPAWFLAAQVARIWSTRGCMTWLASIGVPEYKDEEYARIVGVGPLALIAIRIFFSFNWLEPFQVIAAHHVDTTPNQESATALAIVFGVALATSLTGVLKSHGLPWIIAAAGFIAMSILVAGGYGLIWQANSLTALGLIVAGFCTSKIAMSINGFHRRRALRRADEALADAEEARMAAEGGAARTGRTVR